MKSEEEGIKKDEKTIIGFAKKDIKADENITFYINEYDEVACKEVNITESFAKKMWEKLLNDCTK